MSEMYRAALELLRTVEHIIREHSLPALVTELHNAIRKGQGQ